MSDYTSDNASNLLYSLFQAWEAESWGMHLTIPQSPDQLGIGCPFMETLQFIDIVSSKLSFFTQAVVLPGHHKYLCQELCMLLTKTKFN